MEIQTERLIIRLFTAADKDIQALYEILSDEVVNQYLPLSPLQNIQEAETYYAERVLPMYQNNAGYYLAICLKENNLPIGYVTVSLGEGHDFGYALKKEFWGNGYVTEAGHAVIAELKDTGLKYITATHDILNTASGRVMQKLGMIYQYSYKEQWQPKDILVTFRMYQLNLDDKKDRVFKKYWNMYAEHFVEDISDPGR
ncbi:MULTISPECIES: GNAT family N-acetyltransferase [Oceanobacillus]|uniref:Acetyltransferase n=1 Tax=Oceanobacillus neutriphilus TaxID=531815 RepID=A0ABQ2NW26_9BACI|nr:MULTISPECIES: GNAT family N-acetyltransferase [Oceanobacillus]MCT1902358.1 GNAT family N-acetyltransferase [Oceanobacillus sojae]GGP11949.1 acetyltransferase [Oceanobacillus neutriphilus]